jgi:hypothetical protein
MARASIRATARSPVYYKAGKRHGIIGSIEEGIQICQSIIDRGEATEGYVQMRFPKYERKVVVRKIPPKRGEPVTAGPSKFTLR